MMANNIELQRFSYFKFSPNLKINRFLFVIMYIFCCSFYYRFVFGSFFSFANSFYVGVDRVCVCVYVFDSFLGSRLALDGGFGLFFIVVVLWASVLWGWRMCLCLCVCVLVGDCKHTSLKAPITVTYKKNKKKIDVYTHMQYIST